MTSSQSSQGSQSSQSQKQFVLEGTISPLSLAWVIEWACTHEITPIVDALAPRLWEDSQKIQADEPLHHFHLMAQRRTIILGLRGVIVEDQSFDPSSVMAFKRMIPEEYSFTSQSEAFRLLQSLKVHAVIALWKNALAESSSLDFEALAEDVKTILPIKAPQDAQDDPNKESFTPAELRSNETLANLLLDELKFISSKSSRVRRTSLEKFVNTYPKADFIADMSTFLNELSDYLPESALDRLSAALLTKDDIHQEDLSFETVSSPTRKNKPSQKPRNVGPEAELLARKERRTPQKPAPVSPQHRTPSQRVPTSEPIGRRRSPSYELDSNGFVVIQRVNKSRISPSPRPPLKKGAASETDASRKRAHSPVLSTTTHSEKKRRRHTDPVTQTDLDFSDSDRPQQPDDDDFNIGGMPGGDDDFDESDGRGGYTSDGNRRLSIRSVGNGEGMLAAVPPSPHVVHLPPGKQVRHRLRWSDHEVRELLAGVEKHGLGKWKLILQEFDFDERRRPVDLKDKYRNLKKTQLVEEIPSAEDAEEEEVQGEEEAIEEGEGEGGGEAEADADADADAEEEIEDSA